MVRMMLLGKKRSQTCRGCWFGDMDVVLIGTLV